MSARCGGSSAISFNASAGVIQRTFPFDSAARRNAGTPASQPSLCAWWRIFDTSLT
jgi:hypothetical protein